MFSLFGKKIYIYGIESKLDRITNVKDSVIAAGCMIEGYIDKKCDAIIEETLVGPLSFYENTIGHDKNNYVIILNFHDANTHVCISEDLYHHGFRNIVFLPFDTKYDLTIAKKLRRIYNLFLYGGITDHIYIPCYDELLSKKSISFIQEYGDFSSFWCATDDLFCEFNDLNGNTDVYDLSRFDGECVTRFSCYNELYDFFYSGGKYPEEYLAYNLQDREPHLFLLNRKKMYDEMKYRMKYDTSFFEDSPVLVHFDNRHSHLSVVDGYHRISFMIKNDYKLIPVICKKNDFDRYCSYKEG